MPGYYEITYLPEGRVEKFAGSRGNYYELEDGSHIDIYTEPVWCRRCGKVTHGEWIKPLAELERQLRDLSERRLEILRSDYFPHDLGVPYSRDYLEDLRRRCRWRAARKSPPKCIHCGSTDIIFFPDGPIPHPAGEGTVEVQCVGHCSTVFNEWYFTPEGDRIPRETQPTYWHYPGFSEFVNRYPDGGAGR